MRVVILGAGPDKDFQDEYSIAKILCPVDERGTSMIAHVVNSLSDVDTNPVIVIRSQDEHNVRMSLVDHVGPHVIPRFVTIDNPQCGASMSMLAATCALDEGESVLATFADHIIAEDELYSFKSYIKTLENHPPYQEHGCMLTFDSGINKFAARSPWSHVTFKDPLARVKIIDKVTEKVAITQYATCGMYYVPSWYKLREAIMDASSSEELRYTPPFFLAPVFEHTSCPIESFLIPAGAFKSLGSVDRYQSYLHRDSVDTP